jgi:two-component system LytT family sensor kinase
MLRVALPVWTVFALVCAAPVLWGVRTHGHSTSLILVYQLLVWWGWAAATLAIAALGRRAPLLPWAWRRAALHLSAAIAVGLAHHAWWSLLLVVLRPFDSMGHQDLASALRDDVIDRLFLEVALYAAVLGVTWAVDYQRRLRERELRAAQLETSLAQARLAALELQLRPHFLFNTLHTIGGLVRQKRGAEAVEMIAGLSDLLRYSLDHAGSQRVPLEQELAITGRYLEIQKTRFADRLTVTIDAPDEARAGLVPALLLQPLVENAVRHGIERSSQPGRVDVRARREGARLVVEVENSGPPVGAGPTGIGLDNARARLEQLYPGQHRLDLRSESGAGAVATVVIPWEEPAP